MSLKMLLIIVILAAPPLKGDAAFSYRIRSAAQVRGIDTGGLPGVALALDCSRIGERVWVRVGAAWTGPYVVVDCGARADRAWLRDRGRVVDLPWRLWKAWGLPLAPFPVEVSFQEPKLRPI